MSPGSARQTPSCPRRWEARPWPVWALVPQTWDLAPLRLPPAASAVGGEWDGRGVGGLQLLVGQCSFAGVLGAYQPGETHPLKGNINI